MLPSFSEVWPNAKTAVKANPLMVNNPFDFLFIMLSLLKQFVALYRCTKYQQARFISRLGSFVVTNGRIDTKKSTQGALISYIVPIFYLSLSCSPGNSIYRSNDLLSEKYIASSSSRSLPLIITPTPTSNPPISVP